MLDCKQLDLLFIESQQKVTDGLIARKMAPTNGYYGKIPDGESFPLHSGTRIQGYSLARIGIPQGQGWRPVEDAICSTNACDFDPEVISHGSDDFFFSLVAKDMRTDWLCLASLALRAMPGKEIAHFEEGLRNINRHVQEEFRRSRYLLLGEHHLVHTVERAGADPGDLPVEDYTACVDSSVDNGYLFEQRADGEMDENHIRVCVTPGDIDLISLLTLDMLDGARAPLQYDSDDRPVAGVLYDALLCDPRVSNRLALEENELMGSAASYGGYSMLDLSQNFGTNRILRDYSCRNDIYAMRFYPDTAVNDTLSDGAFDENDPATWPRFVRVHPYKFVRAKIGVKAVINKDYLKAPFGISTLVSPRIMDVMSFPSTVSIGSAAVVGGLGYDGTAQWQNPDWECNVNREKGFWKLRFRLAARPNYGNEGYSWFHRVSKNIKLRGDICPINEQVVPDDVTPYCYEGLGGDVDSGLGVNAAIG